MALDGALEPDFFHHQVAPMASRRPKLSSLEDAIGYRFSKRALLEQALTHVSVVASKGGRTKSYQRLEFLGDRVLGLAVAEMLIAAFPKAEEGELSRRFAALVRKDACAAVAVKWGVGSHLRLGPGQAGAMGSSNRAMLGDVCEAIIGAVFLDGGYVAARGVIETMFGTSLRGASSPERDPKSALQEWVQGRGLPPPTYAILDRSGPDHAPEFRIAVTVEGLAPEDATGNSRRGAEQAAAERLLRREGVWAAARG